MAAVRQMAMNTTQLLPYSNNIINGTSREIRKHPSPVVFTKRLSGGILPIPDLAFYSNNWTKIEVVQQGLSADVSCETITNPDPAFSVIKRTGYLFNGTKYHETTLFCNGTNDNGYANFPG